MAEFVPVEVMSAKPTQEPAATGRIDISKASLDCHAHPAGAERQFANTAKGLNALIAWLQQWPVERIYYEATATYHRALEVALADWP